MRCVTLSRLKKVLGLARMSFHEVNHPIAITDVPLEEDMKTAGAGAQQVVVDQLQLCAGDGGCGGGLDGHMDQPR